MKNEQEIKQHCDSCLNELAKFAPDIIYWGPPIGDDRLAVLENKIGFELPADFKYIYKKHNGMSLNGTGFYGLDPALRGSLLDNVCQYEHFAVGNPMPTWFLPFSADGRGNHYCLNLKKIKNGICPVVFWQHDFYYDTIDEVEECNDSFVEWIDEVMIGWTLEDFDYDGTEK